MKRLLALTGLAVCLAAGCKTLFKDDFSPEMESKVQEVEAGAQETQTLSALANIQAAVADYYKLENRIPENLDALVPKYLAEIPTVELGNGRHRDTALVQIYPSDVLRGGEIDGSRLKDTGRWGYVFNDRQVVVFVDCTHLSSRGKPWYQETPESIGRGSP